VAEADKHVPCEKPLAASAAEARTVFEAARRQDREGWSRWVGATPEESIDIALSLDALAQSARSGAVVDVGCQPVFDDDPLALQPRAASARAI
jgi:hypothetical protein